MTKEKDFKIACSNCRFEGTSSWLWAHSLVQCMNPESEHYQHILHRWHGCCDAQLKDGGE